MTERIAARRKLGRIQKHLWRCERLSSYTLSCDTFDSRLPWEDQVVSTVIYLEN